MDQNLLGVVSTKPGKVLDDGSMSDPKVPIALKGRVPVKVSTQNGIIHKGDYLTSSDIPGVAVKATQAGEMLGKAMEDYTDTSGIGTITVFIGTGYAQPLVNIGDYTLFAQEIASLNGNAFGVQDAAGNQVTQTGVFSDGVIGNLKAGSIDAQKLMLAGQSVGDRLDSLASTAASLTDQVNSLNSRVASSESQLSTFNSQLSTLNSTVDLLMNMASMSGSFGNFNASSAAELSLDKLEVTDATMSGSLNVLGRATFQDVGITGKVNVGLLAINGLNNDGVATIDTIAGPLKIQSEGLQGIDFENSKVTIDTSGNITSQGEITIKKVNIDTTDVAGASAGVKIIPAGTTSIDVDTTALTPNSLIFVTPDSPVAVGAKAKDSNTFTIKLNTVQSTQVKVNWWIVN